MTRFSTNKQKHFLRPVYFYSCCHGNGTYVSLTIKKPKFVLLTCLLPFLVAEGSRVLEKKVNETQVSKTVFSHLNVYIDIPENNIQFKFTCKVSHLIHTMLKVCSQGKIFKFRSLSSSYLISFSWKAISHLDIMYNKVHIHTWN